MGTLNLGRGGVVGTGQYIGRTKWARAYYDFDTDGGAQGAIVLRGDKVPNGAVVLDTIIDVTDPVTGGAGATLSLGINSATDVRAAATLSTAPSLAAAATPHGAVTRATAALNSDADNDITATVAVNDLTAGAFSVLVEYVELASVV